MQPANDADRLAMDGDTLVARGGLLTALERSSPPDVPVSAVFASARFLAPKVRAFIEVASAAFGPGRH